ncbi:MAG: flagellar M-ring protein FliF [Proteobacteria bacterium]|nr:flagellar M-ring protein FliF [Pseudomonadota bacterium]MBU1639955.1 flagellar M-ring protein FliF [Pseudomonadota bacterium]
MAGAKEIIQQGLDVLKSLPLMQKAIAGLVVAVVLFGLLSLTFVSSKPGMKVLYANLNSGDAADIVAQLKEQRVPYELAENGTAILVAQNDVYEIRLAMASEGLPKGAGVGFEIFDKTSLGTTDFVQKLNYHRALQGELARTITQFDKIKAARVHIAQPKESVFVEDTQPPTASISVSLAGRDKLSKQEIKAIVNLVGSAIPGLEESNITLVDTGGHLLFRKDGDEDTLLSATQIEYQQKIESTLRNKLETMFEEVVGVEKVIARVSTDVDFDHVDISEEEFDPETQVVRSEQVLTERDGAADSQQGIPGVKGQLATYTAAGEGEGGGLGFKRDNITRNYEVSKKVTRTKAAIGQVRKLSVAIMVDGTYNKTKKDGKVVKEYQARSDQELATFLKMAQNAVGYDPERGDQVEVVSMPFYLSSYEEPTPDMLDQYHKLLNQMALPVALLLVAICFFMFVIRPFFRLMANQQLVSQRMAEQAEHELVAAQSPEDLSLTPLGMTDKERIYKLAQSDPDRAADLVRRWLREGM